MSKDNLNKFFPLNRIIVAKTLGLLCMLIGSYYMIAVILYELTRVLQLINIVGRIFVLIELFVKIYCFCGILIGCCQYLIRNGYAQTGRANINELYQLIENKFYRTIIIAIAAVYCFVIVFHKEDPSESRHNVKEIAQIDDMIHVENVSHNIQEVTEIAEETDGAAEIHSDTEADSDAEANGDTEADSDTEANGDAETEAVMRQNQLDLYEDIKGFWQGSDIQYTFMRINDQYCFFDSNSLGDELTNANFYIAYYNVEAYEKADNIVKAAITDGDGRTYDLEVYLDTDHGRSLNIKHHEDSEWTVLTDNTYFSYQELLDAGEYKALWMARQNYNYYTNEIMPYNSWISVERDDKFCFLDVTDQYEGDELIICYASDSQSNSYYVLGIKDGYVQPLYSSLSFLDKECYDTENKIFWTFYYGGTAGGSCYRRMIYDEEQDGWLTEECSTVSGNCVRLSLEKIW